MNMEQNNLQNARSPYLLQHANQPVWWQPWEEEVLKYAREQGKPILVSVGYATCHWCHVMAREVFSDQEYADFLNQNMVAIKVDREERPDIDQYLMSFMIAQSGQGGWPLNVFLAPAGEPLISVTYLPLHKSGDHTGFFQLTENVLRFLRGHEGPLKRFTLPKQTFPPMAAEKLVDYLWSEFDRQEGGFGLKAKFPPHSTLLFLLYLRPSGKKEEGKARVDTMLRTTLRAMLDGGLYDHVGGGIFRYCTDRRWTVPHFEKMLYDQALFLWVVSIAAHIYRDEDPQLAEDAQQAGIETLRMVEREFKQEDGLFVSAFDAEAGGEEGGSYLWSTEEIEEVLSQDDFRFSGKADTAGSGAGGERIRSFFDEYELAGLREFGGRGHIVRRRREASGAGRAGPSMREIKTRLRAARKERSQPSCDDKILTAPNALLGIALIHADRYLVGGEENAGGDSEDSSAMEAAAWARKLFSGLEAAHLVHPGKDGPTETVLAHSSRGGRLQTDQFLEDAASMALFATFLEEDYGSYREAIDRYLQLVEGFRHPDLGLLSSLSQELVPVPATIYDSPVPSGPAMVDLSRLRSDILKGKETAKPGYSQPAAADFRNLAALVSEGGFRVVTAPEPFPWERLSANTIQVHGDRIRDCYQGICREYSDRNEFFKSGG
ncbi:MAG: DUF255 domain-containing protein [Spirochaetales bacterium]|nr:DUF255 domain-containing protein [Spirochaetales bacterium]MCF7938719.1 DUF255 domain-containing protein [Spirochaetales bacterium]